MKIQPSAICAVTPASTIMATHVGMVSDSPKSSADERIDTPRGSSDSPEAPAAPNGEPVDLNGFCPNPIGGRTRSIYTRHLFSPNTPHQPHELVAYPTFSKTSDISPLNRGRNHNMQDPSHGVPPPLVSLAERYFLRNTLTLIATASPCPSRLRISPSYDALDGS
jgi:hypothetical protein